MGNNVVAKGISEHRRSSCSSSIKDIHISIMDIHNSVILTSKIQLWKIIILNFDYPYFNYEYP